MTSIILAYGLLILSGVLNAFHDALYHHEIGKGDPFWDPYKSWVNKYKKSTIGSSKLKERFPGSTTVFVMFTDGIHMIKFIMYSFLIIGASHLNLMQSLIGIIVFLTAFEIVYSVIDNLK